MFRALAILAVALVVPGQGFTQQIPPEIEAVRTYLLRTDYPELFKDTPYRTRIENAILADLDGDGRPEVIAQFAPHYRQSATIQIYKVSPDRAVSRIREGLAPGPLVPLMGEFLDSHTLGLAVDFQANKKDGTPVDRTTVREATFKRFGNLVEYRNFFHADARSGSGYYIDMTQVDDRSVSNCESFQFSKVDQIAAGKIPTIGIDTFLTAVVGRELFIYRINGVDSLGLLDKTIWVASLPSQFENLVIGDSGELRLATTGSRSKTLAVRCTDDVPGKCSIIEEAAP
jgi:hypothetical protein